MNLGKEFIKQVIINAPTIIGEEIKKIDLEKEIENFKEKWEARKTAKANSDAQSENIGNAVISEVNAEGMYDIQCNMPGVSKKNVEVELSNDGWLNITAEQGTKAYAFSIAIGEDEPIRTELKLGVLNVRVKQSGGKTKKFKVQ